jgi:2-phosphosulfolactate phosphatase
LPDQIPAGQLAGGVVVVVDVLRATTVMVHALASGCEAVVPCLEIEEARRLAGSMPEGSALLAGERQGVAVEGFDLGNSPGAFVPEVCRGTTLVMTTTNGTRAILACLEARAILVGAFVNVSATVEAAELMAGPSGPVHVVCAGTDGLVSWEDSLLAGLLVTRLEDRGFAPENDPAWIVRSAWLDAQRCLNAGTPLRELIARGRGGRRVLELGLGADIEAAAEVDRFGLVAELRRGPVRIVARRSPV